jgi:glycosyltransferase involved in cell wall biosynthesis
MTKKPSLAIISTYDELCGIAGYTKALVPQLEKDFDVEVFDLDQFLFRHETFRVQKLADREIEKMCEKIAKFDCVNIQLEHGTFGRRPQDIYRRIRKLIKASKSICITFHTILPSEPLNMRQLANTMLRRGPFAAWRDLISHRRNTLLDSRIYNAIATAQKKKHTSVVVHTRRDMRMLKLVHNITNVYDHPLAFVESNNSLKILSESSRENFPQLAALPKDAVVLGCFGFIGRYKGIDTAIKALRLCPANYHIAIFGGLHPNEIKKGQPLDPFIAELLGRIQPEKKWISAEPGQMNLTISAKEMIEMAELHHPDDLSNRVHFIGALSDTDFPKAMAVCDTVLMPYMEVGQSSSGPMSIAVDLRKHIIAARTKAFMQFSRYHPNRFSMFEVGNYLELSQLIRSQVKSGGTTFDIPAYNTETNARVYKTALEGAP